jgi:hypothetical protein
MATSRFDRWSGLAALVGGALWVVAFAVNASRSSAESSDAPYVSLHGLGVVGLLSVLLVAVGFVGLDMHMPSGPGAGYGTLGRAGYGVALLGLCVMLLVSGASGGMGMLGIFILMVGSLLVGAAALLRRVLPRWGAIVLIVGSLLLLMFATEGLRAWCGVPYGAAWIVVGYLLFSGRVGQVQAARRVR